MARLRGRCPRGQRLNATLPWGHWKTTTFVAGLRLDGLHAPMVLDGAMDGDAFRAYLEQILAPCLQSGTSSNNDARRLPIIADTRPRSPSSRTTRPRNREKFQWCQRRLKIRPKGGAKDCHLGWWSDLGVRLGVGDAVRGFFGGSGQRSHAELKRSAPAGRPQGGMVYRVGVGLATRASGARCRPGAGRRRAAVQLSALFLRARLWLRR